MRKIACIGMMSFSSGSVFFFLVSTLGIWLRDNQINKNIIGLAAITTLPYAFKILFAFLIEGFRSPIRKLFSSLKNDISWGLFAQTIIIVCFIILIVLTRNNKHNLYSIIILCTILSAAAVIQDIILETQRVNYTDRKIFNSSIPITYLTFRLGMMASGAVTLFIVEFFIWQYAFIFMIFTIIIGMFGMLLINSMSINSIAELENINNIRYFKEHFLQHCIRPLANRKIIKIFFFIFFYKICDSTLHSVSNIFFLDMNYSKIEIASIGKIWWIICAVISGIVSSKLLKKYTIYTTIFIGSIGQCISTFMFLINSFIEQNVLLLLITYSIDSFVSAMCTIAMLSYRTAIIKKLSNEKNASTITNVSIIGSFSSITRVLMSVSSFVIAHIFSWFILFLITFCISIILIFIMFIYKKHIIELDQYIS